MPSIPSAVAGVVLLVSGSALCGCARPGPVTHQPLTQPVLQQYGAMRSVLREGHIEPRVALAEFTEAPGTYGVGAAAGLDGEVTIVDGQVWLSRVRDKTVVTSEGDDVTRDFATMLFAGQVGSWHEVHLEDVVGDAQLEALIEALAAERGINTAQPFPFMIIGRLGALEMHVINGFCPHSDAQAVPENEPWRLSVMQPVDATIVGIFARDFEGQITHHGTSIHAHALISVNGQTATGHVDSWSVLAGSTLRLPLLTASPEHDIQP